MKVAIVCDWLESIGGAERVVLALHQMYPDAPIYTSQYKPENVPWLEDADVRTTWLQKLPTGLKKFLPILRAYTFNRLDLSEYDLVISSTGAEAKGIKTGPKTTHICYCLSPTQYYWIRRDEYLKAPGFPLGFNWLARLGLKFLEAPLKRWDKHAAKQPDYMVAISSYDQENIKKYYGRDAIIIHPPVDVDRFKLKANPPSRHGLVIAGRQTPYKRVDLAIEACNRLKIPLIVIGNGPDHKKLEKLAGRTITFLTNTNDLEIVDQFQSSLGFIFPNADDFGIVAVESLSAGTPVIAYKKGGALDYIKEGKNGIFFDRQTVASLTSAIEKALSKNFDHKQISESADQFSTERFKKEIKDYARKVISNNV
ncbi:MAG TPA: glycosyltransferase [Candidatus Saccharimonadales bacterium]|jgi:glycosyltransferase involved in cell wall biosynthesis